MFLEFYFRRIAGSPHGVIYLCKDGEKIAGLIIGIASKEKIHTFPFFFWGALVTLWQLVISPRVFILALRHLKRMVTGSRHLHCATELESLAVAVEYRRRGIGARLVRSLEDFFTAKDIRSYELVTDMVEGQGYKFYEQLGFVMVRRVSLLSLESRIYQKKIPRPAASPTAILFL